MVFRNNKAHLPVAFEDGTNFHVWNELPPSSRLWREKIKIEKIEKRRPITVVTGRRSRGYKMGTRYNFAIVLRLTHELSHVTAHRSASQYTRCMAESLPIVS